MKFVPSSFDDLVVIEGLNENWLEASSYKVFRLFSRNSASLYNS
jgi:hypothetical protein